MKNLLKVPLLKAPVLWYKSGSPWIWLNGGAVTLCMLMVIGLLGLIAARGFGHFWPSNIVLTSVTDNAGHKQIILGEVVRNEVISAAVARDNGFTIPAEQELLNRYLINEYQLSFLLSIWLLYLKTFCCCCLQN
ncbi:MAG: hypothetical protein EOO68_10450 [Moraxellaceae bacterium]|nr:MAG: hypothetical protein EOO68_10450 [Moraxellaceae bacterium]